MPHVEVLAPAGSPESFEAALQAGADAVYLGLREFNARGNAINFTSEELAFHVPRAHAVGTSVYLTLNTIVKTAEMRSLMKSLDLAVSAGIDGVIFQDLGLGDLILRYYPHLRRHASTQLAIHNLDGVQFCVDRGIQRVVLARELTIEEIRDIRDRFPSNVIELEVFCHGAMCYTYSGLCFFSGSVGGRSGNRGECAYTCRKGYRIHNERHFPKEAEKGSYLNYLFSMKDMMTLELVEPLVESGVDSLKIEGRRKGPAYVHAAVSAYRQRLAGKDTDLENDLKLAFARQPTKAFYLRGQFGDAPVDTFSPGTQGVYLGTIGADGWFTLETSGLQRYDGLRLVYPNRQEHLRSFKNYRVSSGDSMRPGKGVRVKLAENHPHGTLVMWTHSQDVSQKYSVDQPMIRGVAPIFGTVDTRATIEKDQLTIEMKSNRACVRTVLPLEPSENTLSLEDVLHRFGDSPFRSGTFEGPVGFGFVPMKIVKEVRRKMLAELATKHQEAIEVHLDEVTFERKPFKTQTHPSYIVRVDQLDLAQALLPEALSRNWSLDIVLRSTWSTPAWRSAWAVLRDSKVPLRWVLPPVMRKWDVRVLNQRIKSFGDLEMDWVVSNPGHLAMLKRWGVKTKSIHADFSLYHINPWAVQAIMRMGVNGHFTLSLEDDKANMEDLLCSAMDVGFEAIVYTDTPLFVAEACSLAALYGGCPGAKVCGHETLTVENDHGDRFHIHHDRCRSTVIGEQPLSWSGERHWFQERGVSRFRADFTVRQYALQEVLQVMEAIRHNEPIAHSHQENLNRVLL